MTFITPRFYLQKFSTIDDTQLNYRLVAVEQRRLGRKHFITYAHLEKKKDELYSFILDNIGATLHTIDPDELLALNVSCLFPGTFQYELAVINTPYGPYHVFYCLDTRRLIFTERSVASV